MGVLVEVLVTRGCPYEDAAIDLVGAAASALQVTPRVVLIEVRDLAQARRRHFVGSPTILVEGRDVSPPVRDTPGLECRSYDTSNGRSGLPDVHAVSLAMADAGRSARWPRRIIQRAASSQT
jgi:hypothetical protein